MFLIRATRRAVLFAALAGMAFAGAKPLLADADDAGDDRQLLQGTEWNVTEIAGAAIAADWPVTIAFDEDGRYSGRACNGFGGSYTAEGDSSLSLGPAMATKMACPEPGMSQENALFEALERVSGYSLQRNGALWLTDDAGERVIVASR